MTRTRITLAYNERPPGRYGQTGRRLRFVAGDAVNGNAMLLGRSQTLLLARNDGGGDETVTVTPSDDRYGRDVPTMTRTLAAGELAALGPFPVRAWEHDGDLHVDVTASDLVLAGLMLGGEWVIGSSNQALMLDEAKNSGAGLLLLL